MKLKTKEFQAIIPVIKSVVGNNELKPLTTMLGIKTTADSIVFYAMGRDRIKYPVKVDNPVSGIDIAVNADLFLNLVNMTTTEEIELSVDDAAGVLVFKGNGSYKIPKQISEVGDIKFADIVSENLQNTIGNISKDFVKKLKSKNGFALNTGVGVMSTENYHVFTDKTVTSDSNILSVNKESSGLTKNTSLSPITVNTLDCLGSDVKVYEVGTAFLMSSGDVCIEVPLITDADTFPADAICDGVKDENFDKTVSVGKKDFTASLDRINLFIPTGYPITLEFSSDDVKIQFGTEQESIPLSVAGSGGDFKFTVDTSKLKSLISATDGDTITFKFKTDNTYILRIDDGNCVMGISSAD